VLYAWALWPVRWIRPIAIIANAAMFASTPIDGGHYFIDLIAGFAIAILAIRAARALSQRIGKVAVPSTLADAPAPAR
jgi:membrane-associated phospholipid phosphatase